MKKPIHAFIAFLAVAVTALASPHPAAADVRDAGEFFSPQAEREADQLMQQIRQRHGKDVVVETVQSLPNVPAGTKERDDFYAGEVARRGREAGVNGVYLLVSRQPTYAYPGVDPDTQRSAFTAADRSALRDVLVNRFKQKDYDGGLLEGLRLVDQRMAANASSAGPKGAGAAGAGAAAPPAAERPTPPAVGGAAQERSGGGTPAGGRSGMGIGGWLCLIAGALIVFAIVRTFMARSRARAAGYGAPGMMGQPGYDPRTGQPMGGYDPRYGPPQGAGGGMMGGGMGRGLLGGLLGGMAGGYLYDKMSGGGQGAQASPLDPNTTPVEPADPSAGLGGGDFGGGGGDLGGGDFGGGGDVGGGDFGGGE